MLNLVLFLSCCKESKQYALIGKNVKMIGQ